MGQLAGSNCQATLVKVPHAAIAAKTTGNCQGDHLTLYLATNSTYNSQTAIGTTSGTQIQLPCGYWQADYYSGTVRSIITHEAQSGTNGNRHVQIAARRGYHTCSPPVTTTTTIPATTSTTVPKKTKTTQPQTGSSSGDGGSHPATPATAAHASTGALAFTGAPVGIETGFAMTVAIIGSLLVRLARQKGLRARPALARSGRSARNWS